MKPIFPRITTISFLIALLLVLIPVPAYANSLLPGSPKMSERQPGPLQDGTVTPPTVPPPPTETPEPLPVVRPQVSVQNYQTKPENVYYGQNFALIVKLRNHGEAQAFNVQANFASGDFVPLRNGGVNVVGDILPGNSVDIEQPMTVANWVSGIVSVTMNLAYSDINGTSYSETFTLNIRVSGGSGVAVATSTPTGVKSSQLVITSYSSSVDPLQPGEQFRLTMTVQNAGNAQAQRVTMIVGGGSATGSSDGTPQPGGVSGGSGEFTNFAPVGASNVQTLGDLGPGGMVQASQDLIVNVSTNPGAYPMKVTFSYLNEKGESINDEQVITLLVYSLPQLDISFYRPPDPFFVGQPGMLPVQVVNLGKRTAVLGTMKIESTNGTIENATGLVGSLDAGGYFTLDAMVFPEQSGPMMLEVTIDYTDDFNQSRTVTRTLEIEVMEGMEEPIMEPGMEGGEAMPPVAPETTWQRIWRFVLGIFGLDSAPPPSNDPGIVPGPGIEEPLPAPQPGSGKG
ncbi:MAG: hypothetical protein M3Y68_13890 [Chloroflexota bacterium]|nr:hypothetical protein [Chloroflexota bacterium]